MNDIQRVNKLVDTKLLEGKKILDNLPDTSVVDNIVDFIKGFSIGMLTTLIHPMLGAIYVGYTIYCYIRDN